jgi:carboxylesterase
MEAPRAVLCLHGFTGTPFDVSALAKSLEAGGHLVAAPMLPGHGGVVDDLAEATADQWLSAADAALTRLADTSGGRVAIAGASMGALLALRLARLRPDAVAALVLMAPPLRWRPVERAGVEVLARLAHALGIRKGTIPKTGGVDIADSAVRVLAPSLSAYPIAALRHLIALTDAAAADVPSVTAPALVIHGRRDRTVQLEVSEELASKLGSDIVERLWLENSGHLVAVDHDRAKVAAAVTAFLARHAVWIRPHGTHDFPARMTG